MPCLIKKNKAFKLVKIVYLCLTLAVATQLGACKDDDIDSDVIEVPNTYDFKSLNQPEESSVNYRAATTRLLLIKELESLIESDYLQQVGEEQGETAVISILNTVYEGGTFNNSNSLVTTNIYDSSDIGSPTPIRAIKLEPSLSLIQKTYSDITPNINIKNLLPSDKNVLPLSKNGITKLLGWSHTIEPIHTYIDTKIQAWFRSIAQIAADGDPTTKYTSNINYKALLVNFLYGAIGYAQTTNSYLKDPIQLTSNQIEGTPTLIEKQHKWDMAFGYFGAPASITETSHEHLRNAEFIDINKDGLVDIYSEAIISDYINTSAGLDADSVYLSTNFTNNLMNSFLLGRALIDASPSSNDQKQLELTDQLKHKQQLIIEEWEKVIAAQMIHTINIIGRSAPYWEVLSSYDELYINNWSILKAQALILQFSPSSSFTYDELHQMHIDIGTQPYKQHALNSYLGKIFNLRQDLMLKFEFSDIDVENW